MAMTCLLMLAAVSACTDADDEATPSRPTTSGTPAVECTEASAQAADRAQVLASGVEPDCVKVAKGASFTLLNADEKQHSFSTTPESPVELRVDLKEGSAFPYRFKKPGTYVLEEGSSGLELTIFVS